jgi:TonB-linked SusC/RagA family outer membrane protein
MRIETCCKLLLPLAWQRKRAIAKTLLVMKLTIILLFVSALQVSAKVAAQTVTYSGRSVSLQTVFAAIKKQTNYTFFYRKDDLKSIAPVTVELKNADLSTALEAALRGQPLDFEVQGRTIFITRRPVTKAESAPEQQVKVQAAPITGIVRDSTGTPLVGASVKIKGADRGTSTDANGQFTIEANAGEVLIVSYVGYETREITISGTGSINIVLRTMQTDLSNVVIIGYGRQSQATVSSAVTRVDGKNIGMQPVATPGEALAGLAAGVQVQSNQGAKPGEAPVIRIRGVGSLSSSTEPLYVVDGYPLQTSAAFAIINPSDIESIHVLKDAAASAIYGSRAANGVVIVTTKKGRKGKTAFTASSYYGLQNVNRYIDMLKRDDYISYSKTQSRIRGVPYPAVFDRAPDSLPDVDWQREVFRTAPLYSFDIGASGGSDNMRYNASFGYYNQKGVMLGTEFTRITSRINMDADLSPKLKLSASISPSYTDQYKQGTSGQFNTVAPFDQLTGVPGLVANRNVPSPLNSTMILAPVIPVYKDNGDFAQPYDRALGYNTSATSVFFQSNLLNPVGILTQVINRSRAFRTLGNVFLEYSILDGLKLKTFLGATLENERNNASIPATAATDQSPTASFSNPLLSGIFASENVRNSFDWVWENTATYDKLFGDHHINVLALYSAQKFTSTINYTGALAGTYVTTAVQNPLASPSRVGTVGYDDNNFVSIAGRLSYDFKQKYLLTAAIRRDGSSRFGPNNRFAVFPSFSAGWRLSEEPWLAPLLNKVFINELKLRGGYGETGNANIGSFTYLNSMNINTNYAFGNTRQFGATPTGFPNPALTWEKNSQTSVGIDLGFMDNRITLSVDYFSRISDGMLLNKDLPAIVGYATNYQSNLGKLRNNGLEFVLGTDFKFGELRWNVNANLSSYRTKVLNLGGPASLPPTGSVFGWNNSYQVKVGDPLSLMYGYTVTGVFKNAADLANNPQTTAGNKIGDWIVKDLNGDKKIDVNDMGVLGHGLPDFTYGLTNTFQYRNFDLSILIQGVQGVNIINGNLRQQIGGQHQNSIPAYFNNFFDPAAPDRDVKYPQPNSTSAVNPQNALVQYAVENGSYLRFRNITLGYRLPETILKRILLKSARVYITSQNPFLITKYTGYNPEASVAGTSPTNAGTDQGTYPTARTLGIGINIGF